MTKKTFQVHIFLTLVHNKWSFYLFQNWENTMKKMKILTTYRDLLCAIWFVFLNFYSGIKFLTFLCYLSF